MDALSPLVVNELGQSSSLYLQQHANNPVHWQMWSQSVWQRARRENKPVLVSIGYSACHWCHVMEHESFEHPDVAELMNEHFICIKVDREERPDVDHVYMQAVQLMTGSGGWPLNCFCLPDGSPFYAGTYFPRTRWLQILQALADAYERDRDRVQMSASEAVTILRQSIHLPDTMHNADRSIDESRTQLHEAVRRWSYRFDERYGGEQRAPKFPMPATLQFLMAHSAIAEKAASTDARSDHTELAQLAESVRKHIDRTLHSMALGGLNDHLAGGFARYSTDRQWKVPHFEKMLYDNAQLVSVYSNAYRSTSNPFYQDVVQRTLTFIEREMTAADGCFFTAIDADSSGEEGAYYLWREEELRELCGEDFETFALIYSIQPNEVVENSSYILHRSKTNEQLAVEYGFDVEWLRGLDRRCRARLLEVRNRRIRPARDEKRIVCWNALMILAYADAYRAFADVHALEAALRCARTIVTSAMSKDAQLLHCFPASINDGGDRTPGFLDDYAALACACISLYELTSDGTWLQTADRLIHYALVHFDAQQYDMFTFASNAGEQLVTQTVEIHDTVIPSSNSMMARALFDLGVYLDNELYTQRSRSMIFRVVATIEREPSYTANWSLLYLRVLYHDYRIAIVGSNAQRLSATFEAQFHPNTHVVWSSTDSTLPLFRDKTLTDQTLIYVCDESSCQAPVLSVEQACLHLRPVA